MAVATPVMVTMAEISVARKQGHLACLGLGSCVGICAMDADANVGGMAHIMLPESYPNSVNDRPAKFADTGIPELIRVMERHGASRSRIAIALVGGARVLNFGSENNRLDIGGRNSTAVQNKLIELGLKVVATDLGGNLGRTVTLSIETGHIRVRTVSQGERLLCSLRD